jgi:hypothetical protein
LFVKDTKDPEFREIYSKKSMYLSRWFSCKSDSWIGRFDDILLTTLLVVDLLMLLTIFALY